MIKSKIGFVAGFILVLFTYWLSGGEFERSKELAFTFVIANLLGISFFFFGKATEVGKK